MKNPLNKRLLRELKSDMGKYAVIFLFMVLLISMVSAFLVADNSFLASYKEGFEKYNVEDGHVAFSTPLPLEIREELEKEGNITLYDMLYFEEKLPGGECIRVYEDREEVNTECLMKGEMPGKKDEIALDRMFAQNAGIDVGDTIVLGGKELKVTGLVAFPDYSCLFRNNSDMMFDAVHFCVGVMSKEGFAAFDSSHITYNYAYRYLVDFDREDKALQKDQAEALIKSATTVMMKHSFNLKDALSQGKNSNPAQSGEKETDTKLEVTDFLPRYLNKAINFTGEDMGSDKVMFIAFDYIVTVVLAFVFAVTISNTIAQEATTIGTLRASGYSRGELIRHYMTLPMAVTLAAAIVGNILGYTVLKEYMVQMYYGSYSLPTYKTLWNAEAFVDTTLIPLVLMFVINLWVLTSKLKLSPLRFLRKDLSKRGRKKAFRLNTRIPIMHRFRLRILFQNIPNYVTLFFGIFFGGVIVVFSLMFGPLLEDYAKLVSESKIANYQYVLTTQLDTETEGAEKYCVTELETTDESYMIDEVMIYGIEEDSAYVKTTFPAEGVLINNGLASKFSLKTGDTLSLKDPYEGTIHDFKVAGIYTYDASLSVFMTREAFNTLFDEKEDYFTGYFSNTEISDIDSRYIAGVITEEDLTKMSTQLKVSMGSFMGIFRIFGVIMFLLLMFIMSKQIIEKNSQSISMTKILGFTNGEIGMLYILATSMAVLFSLLATIPLVDLALRAVFKTYLYKEMTGYMPYIISGSCYVKMFGLGVACYILVSVFQLWKISKISKSDALKNVE